MLLNFQSLSIGTLDQNTAKGQNGLQALMSAISFYGDDRKRRYVIIRADGFNCIAHLADDDYCNGKMDEIVFPYDEKKVYPIQRIEAKYSFVLY